MDGYREEARLILEAIAADRFILRDHAIRRGDERELSRRNVVEVAETLIEWRYQEEKFTHRFLGYLDEGRPGGFAAILDEGEARVVTVFKRRLSRREREGASPSSGRAPLAPLLGVEFLVGAAEDPVEGQLAVRAGEEGAEAHR
jgi:predicted nucleotidyltransferase